jgi:hypothetical protein
MDQPQDKKANGAHDQGPTCPADGLAVNSAVFERAALSDLQHHLWIGRSMKEKFWDLNLMTDGGHKILIILIRFHFQKHEYDDMSFPTSPQADPQAQFPPFLETSPLQSSFKEGKINKGKIDNLPVYLSLFYRH